MFKKHKVIYERRDGNLSKREEILVERDTDPTFEELHEIVRKDATRFHNCDVISYVIISVESFN